MERARHALIHFCAGVYRGFDTRSIAKVMWFCIVIIFFARVKESGKLEAISYEQRPDPSQHGGYNDKHLRDM